MRKFPFQFVSILAAAGFVLVAQTSCLAAEPAAPSTEKTIKDQVLISIRPDLKTDSRVIRLVDVASITGGDPALRDRLKQLDIEDSLTPGESVSIQASQIEFRVRIAGIDMDRISIRGSAIKVTAREAGSGRDTIADKGTGAVTDKGVGATFNPSNNTVKAKAADFSSISEDEGPLEREIIQAAKSCLLSKLPWPAENVECRLLQSLPPELRQVNSAAGYEFSAEVRSPGPPVGRVQVRVIAEATKMPTIDLNLVLEVRHFEDVVLAAKTIDRGHQIVAGDLYTDRQDVTELVDYCSNSDDLIGTTARRSIRALTAVRSNDVEAKNRAENQVVIKRRDQVKMIARLGTLSVTAMGEALQDGRKGETIRLRNLESNTNIQGRVIASGEVEIAY
jgi:flagella basal body P-ring formation protein FlgA